MMEHIFLAERTMDCDGRGWAFRRFTVPSTLVRDYADALERWERERAGMFNYLIDVWEIAPEMRSRFVNGGAFDISVDSNEIVKLAARALDAARSWVERWIITNEDHVSTDMLSVSDMVTHESFLARYRPLILAADDNNGNHSHEDYFAKTGYTSIFNGR